MIFDTNILIDHLRQKDRANTIFHQLTVQTETRKISIITHAELYSGKSPWENQTAKADVERLLFKLTTIPLTKKISKLAGKFHAYHKTPMLDAIIAATAIAEAEPLATLNPQHFTPIPRLRLVKL